MGGWAWQLSGAALALCLPACLCVTADVSGLVRDSCRHYPRSSLRFVGVADLREAVPVVFARDYEQQASTAPAAAAASPPSPSAS